MFGALALITVRKQQYHAGGEVPFILAGADELIDDDLCAVHEIAELRFPQDESFGIVATEAVLEAEAAGFRERRVVDFAERLPGREIRERNVGFFGFGIHENGVALVEGTA